ncbi:MAG: glycosyltransferase family 39 protein [Solirubrobacteraceae bacterium]
MCALGAGLRLYGFERVAPTPYYDAAVRSMGLSWHNFFYGAIEPAGQVSIDKTPVELWLQVASTKLLGFSSTTLRLPEAIAGTLAVPLLYDLVRRGFGRAAGLAAATGLAVLPVAVLTSRSDTMDTMMGTLLLLAAWVIIRARPERRRRAVVLAGAIAGLAFEVKLFQTAVALPALALLAWLALESPRVRRARALGLAALAFTAVAAMWGVLATIAPGAHPYPVGSTDGSIWNVLVVYNGIDRLGTSASGAPAPPLLRLFEPAHLGALVGVELIGALAAGALAALLARRAAESTLSGDDQRRRIALGAGLGAWLVTGTFVFSLMSELRPRYLEAFTPAIAGVLGIGVVTLGLAAAHRARAALGLGACAAAAALAALAVGGGPSVTVSIGAALGAVALTLALALGPGSAGRARALAGAAVALTLVAALAVPVGTSARLVRTGAGDSGVAGRTPAATLEALSAYLRANQGRARYELASSSVAKAAPLIVRDARPVLMLTSLRGRPLLKPAQLAAKVQTGQVRFALIGRARCSPTGPGAPGCAPVVQWARAHGADVSRDAGLPTPGALYRLGSR